MANTYDIGQMVRVTFTFTVNGTNTDPSSVFFKYGPQNGTLTTLTYGTDAALVKDSIGVYHVDINANVAARWNYRAWSTGSAQAATNGFFAVTASPI